MEPTASTSGTYRAALHCALNWTIALTGLTCLVLDFGQTFSLSLVAILIFWCTVLVIRLRRPQNPTRLDLMVISWGCPILVLIFNIATHAVWIWRGLE